MRNPLKTTCKRLLDSAHRFGSDFVHREEGQMAPMMMTALLIAYTTFMGAAIDMGNLLWHKNHATTAATASCMSGAADLVWVANQASAAAVANYESSSTGFQLAVNTTGTPAAPGATISGGCASAKATVAMCAYATANGYSPNVSGNDVSWTVSNVLPTQETINPNGAGNVGSFTTQQNATQVTTPNGVLPFLHVTVTEVVPTYLLSIMPSFKSPVTISGTCNCGIGNGGAQGAQELTLTGQCPISDAVYSSEWDIASVSPDQLRTTGGNDPTDWVNLQCNGEWTDSQGNTQPSNYLATIPNVTIDGVTASIDAATQGPESTDAFLWNVELIASNDGFSPPTQCCVLQNLTSLLSGEQVMAPSITVAPATTNYPFYTVGSPTTMWGVSPANMLNALSNDRYFGMAVFFNGNGSRIFMGGGTGQPPFITVSYHTSRYFATMF